MKAKKGILMFFNNILIFQFIIHITNSSFPIFSFVFQIMNSEPNILPPPGKIQLLKYKKRYIPISASLFRINKYLFLIGKNKIILTQPLYRLLSGRKAMRMIEPQYCTGRAETKTQKEPKDNTSHFIPYR